MRVLGLVVALCLLASPGVNGQAFEEFVDFRPTTEQFDFDRWPYPLHAEVNARLQELARQYPEIARVHHIGNSRKGQELLLMEITNFATGSGRVEARTLAASGSPPG